ncbi:MAG: tyrosine-type recombinase/integrase [Pseudolabrys sp.]
MTLDNSAASDGVKSPFHDLRHTHATQLLASGVHPKIAQERLGHANSAPRLICTAM